MTTNNRSRGATLAIWVALNILRLVGFGAILWAIVVEGILLKELVAIFVFRKVFIPLMQSVLQRCERCIATNFERQHHQCQRDLESGVDRSGSKGRNATSARSRST